VIRLCVEADPRADIERREYWKSERVMDGGDFVAVLPFDVGDVL